MPEFTPQDFVSKWKRAKPRERQSVQEHFIDLCALVGHETPMHKTHPVCALLLRWARQKPAADQAGQMWQSLDFSGGNIKAKTLDLDKAYEQFLRYRDALQNPPLLIVSDINHIIIRTNYTNLPTRTITLTLDDLLTAEGLKTSRRCSSTPKTQTASDGGNCYEGSRDTILETGG